MKLRNKKTGEIIETVIVDHGAEWEMRNMYTDEGTRTYNSLAELNEEWEDVAEEPKGNWTIEPINEDCIDDGRYTTPDELERYEELGLKFDTKEETKKAVEKLKAWKRLKDKGFRFVKVDDVERVIHFEIPYRVGYDSCEAEADLDLLFNGGEE